MSTRVAARELRKGDIFPGGGTITKIFPDPPGVIMVEVDYTVLIGPWNHGDPVHICEREEETS